METNWIPESMLTLKKDILIKKSIVFNFLPVNYRECKIEINKLRAICFIISLFPAGAYIMTKHYLLNNMFGVLFAITGIE